MRIDDFALERFFARWEFSAPYVLCASDVEGWAMKDVLALADDETRAMWDGLALGYTEAAGHPLLRAEIASTYQGLTADDVLVFSGAEEAIFACMNVLAAPGDHVLAAFPAYQSLYQVAAATGAEVELLPMMHQLGWRFDRELLRKSLRPQTRAVAVNFPHNPTGALPTPDEFREIARTVEESGAWLFSDEVYRGLERDEADRLPAAAEISAHGISLGVMSKSFAMAGLRIGWIACRDRDLLARLAAYKDYLTICASGPAEVLALIALRARGPVLERSRAIVRGNMARLDAFFAEWAGTLEWVPPRAGSTAFPRIVPPVDIDAFAGELRERKGVLILPGTLFGYPGTHFRLGFGRLNMPEALGRFEEFLVERFGRP
ncbi:MAG: class aminotransferase [Gemmatimonadetes bacterium]|nr:class aminotransferase [Gemmatimonadota bacterium]